MKPDSKLPDSIEPSPEKLLAPFAKGRIAMWMVVAVLVHVLLIGGTSLGYIRDYFDPEGAKDRKAAAELVEAKSHPKAPAVTAPAKAATPATTTATPATPATTPPTTEAKPASDHSNTPIVKKITAVAGTNEIPKSPDDLDINLRDTNPK